MPGAEAITPALLRDWPLPSPGGSKHSRGHLLVVGGSRATPGAALLCGLAALRVGAGVLAMAVAEEVALPLAIAFPEAAVRPLSDGLDEAAEDADAIVIGPGFDDPHTAMDVIRTVVAAAGSDTPLVLDAFALGVLPELSDIGSQLSGRTVLTPNSKEAQILLGDGGGEDAGDDPAAGAQAIADKWGCSVSLQGYVAESGQQLRRIATGHAGLGTSGSGDVLAGSIGGLLARGATPGQATAWGTHLHAAAGDRLAAGVGRLGFLARELTEELPLVLTELLS